MGKGEREREAWREGRRSKQARDRERMGGGDRKGDRGGGRE